MATGYKKCKHCKGDITKVNYALGEEWMHVNHSTSFPTTRNGGLWQYCKIKIAEPEDE